jgi:predicted RecA/RadA family phage recombinase
MRNKVQKGRVITVIAPYAVTGGAGVLVGALFGVAAGDAASGQPVEIDREGVFDITAVTADTATQGAKVYWDNTARRITTTATNNTLVGAVTEAKGGTATTARVCLDGVIR